MAVKSLEMKIKLDILTTSSWLTKHLQTNWRNQSFWSTFLRQAPLSWFSELLISLSLKWYFNVDFVQILPRAKNGICPTNCTSLPNVIEQMASTTPYVIITKPMFHMPIPQLIYDWNRKNQIHNNLLYSLFQH